MAGAHMFQAVQHPELYTLGLVAILDFLKKRARYLRLVAQNNKAEIVNVTPIILAASIDSELLENLNMKEIDAESVDECTDESVMEYLESTQEISASVTAENVKAEASRTTWYDEHRRNSRPSNISLRRIARGRTALSSLHASHTCFPCSAIRAEDVRSVLPPGPM
jgi:hypothetical protein